VDGWGTHHDPHQDLESGGRTIPAQAKGAGSQGGEIPEIRRTDEGDGFTATPRIPELRATNGDHANGARGGDQHGHLTSAPGESDHCDQHGHQDRARADAQGEANTATRARKGCAQSEARAGTGADIQHERPGAASAGSEFASERVWKWQCGGEYKWNPVLDATHLPQWKQGSSSGETAPLVAETIILIAP